MEAALLARRKKGGANKATNGGRNVVNNAKFRRSNRGASGGGGGSSGGKKYYRCTTCSYVTHVKARFTKHVKYHSMPLIKCNFCDFKTPYKWNLDRHLKNHNDDGELRCPLCNFSTDIKQSLTVHVQNHHTSVPEHKRVALGLHAQLAPNDEVEEYENEDNNEGNVSDGEEDGDEYEGEEVEEEEGAVGNSNMLEEQPLELVMEQDDDDDDDHEPKGDEQHQQENEEEEEDEPEGVVVEDKEQVKEERAARDNSESGCENDDDGGVLLPVGKKEEEVEEEEDEDFKKKSQFLQNLSLKPNVMYAVGNGNSAAAAAAASHNRSFPSPPKLTTPKSKRPSSVTSELSGSKKSSPPLQLQLLPELKKYKEKKLGLEELTQKLVAKSEESGVGMLKNSVTITSNSTRCQFCRQRCKTSADLALHLTACTEAQQPGLGEEEEDDDESSSNSNDRGEDYNNLSENGGRVCTSENKIFVWNNKPAAGYEDEEVMDYEFKGHFLDASGGSDDLVGFETAPGVGAVHVGQLEEAEYEGYKGGDPFDGRGSVTTTRKVFRCPQPNCGFWATTASRFHVHIVGHYNMKPFECSQCSYKSNWRWDITKHIKLKELRDPTHTKAKVLLTHESGQRNYRKYDRYLVMMQLKHSADSKLPDCSTVASKRSDVALELSPSAGASVVVVPSPKVSPQQQQQHKPAIAMPKLTRAPITSRASSPSESVKSEEGGHRPRPPPALVPISAAASSGSIGSSSSSAGRTIVEKKMLSGGRILAGDPNGLLAAVSALPEISLEPCSSNIQVNPPRKRGRENGGESKKILWKCKKCPFKHSSKEIVVFHIRQFHKPKRGESVSILSQNHLMSVPDDGESEENAEPQPRKARIAAGKETHQYRYVEENDLFQCKFCPYATSAIVAMEAHAEHHFSKPNCNFSCNQCSFSVSTKTELMEHVLLHGPEALLGDENDTSLTITAEETPPKPRVSNGGGVTHKKYHCTECPYVTDSKGQFLYHKQFHRPRDCPFKCPQCSYNVSHKHLIHQHLRVHGLAPLSPSHGDVAATLTDEEGVDEEQPLDLHQSSNDKIVEDSAHPTVLVWRNGRPFRMYRCRFCPQVFGKLGDLTDHETSHGNSASQSPLHSQQNLVISPVIPNLANGEINNSGVSPQQQNKMLYCCESCPARFFQEKELDIHTTFHQVKSDFQCELCSYSAKQQNPHLMSHMKVHGREYQLKTQQLLQRYPKAPKKKKTPVGNKPMVVPLNIPKVIPGHFLTKSAASGSAAKKRSANNGQTVFCPKCPAKFQSNQSYQQHSTFHGRQSIFRCRNCDYGVDTLKNLTLHELLHAGSEVSSDFESFQDVSSASKKAKSSVTVVSPPVIKDDEPIDDEAYIGNPEFQYPTYIKNGRVKSKRYKCSKCPSAFEKRDQYKVHMGLHGSDQRYKCTVCDYAVTYYANFIQHLKKHSTQPEVDPELLIAKPLSKMRADGLPANKAVASTKVPVPKKLGCTECSFKTSDEKTLNEHMAEHDRAPSYHKCYFCAFVASSKADLKEHVRLHFQVPVDSVQTCLFSDEVDTSYDEKNYSEKENYDDDNAVGSPKGPILKSKLNGEANNKGKNPVQEEDENSEDDGSDAEENGEHRHDAASPEPIDCSV